MKWYLKPYLLSPKVIKIWAIGNFTENFDKQIKIPKTTLSAGAVIPIQRKVSDKFVFALLRPFIKFERKSSLCDFRFQENSWKIVRILVNEKVLRAIASSICNLGSFRLLR